MEIIKVTQRNAVDLQVECNAGIAMELTEFFSFFVPNYKFMPTYKNKQWDGKIKLFNRVNYTLPVGLLPHLRAFGQQFGYVVEAEMMTDNAGVSNEELWGFCKSLNLHLKGKPIQIYDYQFAAVKYAINEGRGLLISPTGSGKSLILYVLMRWYESKGLKKQLLIVPTTQLVEQMFGDWDDYSSHDDSWCASDFCHRIYDGAKKHDIEEPVVISTWQSIFRLNGQWFCNFDVIFGDEVHTFTAKSLSSIMNKSKTVFRRIGVTGTLDGTLTHELVLQGQFGRIKTVTTMKELQDREILEYLKIRMIYVEHSDEARKFLHGLEYHDEIEYLIRNEERNNLIVSMADSFKGNTLVLFIRVEQHGEVLHKLFKDKYPDCPSYFVSGKVDTADREAVRRIVEQEKRSVTFASLGTFSTGINIKNLHNIVFAAPSKGQIKVLQSIGRGLRKSESGQITRLYDIVDDISHNGKPNFALRHGKIRHQIYRKQKQDVELIKVKLEPK